MSWTNVILAALTAVLMTFGFWHQFDPRAIVMFIAGLIVAEIFVQVRWRMGMSCPHCHFDPVLYSKNPTGASQKVRDFYDSRKLSADFYLTGQALIETQRRMQQTARRKRRENPGATESSRQLLSKHI